ncbi:MAG: ABC transporter substrate-binding protein [Ancrocorticia sp.]|uniref:ABC transporter substrate-binding protein n=1 Tax=Ancrocorticia sp. TaxID=2593684 RepID=UPI003F938F6C
MRRTLTAVPALAAALMLTLAACGGDSDSGADDPAGAGSETPGFDVSSIEENPDVSALVPESVASDGKLTVGSNIYYAPAEFYAEDGKTPVGYDVDLMKALSATMGLDLDLQNAEFASILPGIPEKYELGIANISINPERQENFNMIEYFTVGSSWAVQAGNPEGFDPDDFCGKSVGVQQGTVQDEELAEAAQACDEAPDIQRYDQHSAATTALVGGKVVALYSDSSVTDYAIAQTSGQLEQVGDVTGETPMGIVTAKSDDEMTEATQAAVQALMDDGTLDDIFAEWGITDGVSTEAVINPVE